MKKTLKNLFYFLCYPLILSKLLKLKNLHKGEEVYIIADSPELRYMDLSLFDDKPAICFNTSFFISDISNRKSPTYASLIESFHFYKAHEVNGKKLYLDRMIKKLIKEQNLFFFTNLTNYLNFLSTSTYYVYLKFPKDLFTDHQKKFNTIVTNWSVKFAVSLAIYMGFKKIYFLGFSFHNNSLAFHWYTHGDLKNFSDKSYYDNKSFNNAAQKLRETKHIHDFFDAAKQKIDIVGITIFEPDDSYFDYITYENYTSSNKKYKNPSEMTTNFELLSFLNEQHKKSLAKFKHKN